jgi:hypothetical protein
MNAARAPRVGLPVAMLLIAWVLVWTYFEPLGGSDYYWQVATGRLIVERGDLHPPESFTYTAYGRQIPDFEWLYEVVIYATWAALGEPGLALLTVLLFTAPLVAVAWRMRVEGLPGAAAPAALIAMLCTLPMWNPRPLWVSNLALLLAAGWLRDTCAGRATRTFDWRLPALYLVWSNTHPGVIAGQALLVGAVAWEWLNRLVRFNAPLPPGALRRLTVTGLLALAASLVGPDPIGRLLYPFSPVLRHPIMQEHFGELLPVHYFFRRVPMHLGILGLLIVVVLAAALSRPRAVRGWEWALLGCTLLLTILAFRSLADCVLIWLVIGVPVVAARVRSLGLADRLAPVGEILERPCLRWQPWVLGVVLGALAVITVVPPLHQVLPRPADPEYPAAAVTWLKGQLPRGGEPVRVFGIPEFGSYLIWRLGDRVRVYADSRAFYLDPEVIADSVRLPALSSDWRERLERVLAAGTDYFLLHLDRDSRHGQLWQKLARYVPEGPLYKEDDPTVHPLHRVVVLSRAQVVEALNRLDKELGP